MRTRLPHHAAPVARRRATRCLAGLALVATLLASTGCAWANRDNRPVWNAFEEHLVPEGDTAFNASLPLTIVGGLVAILVDTFIVHPAQVIDDAAGDAGELWDDFEPQVEEHYYTQMASLPFRAVFTPVRFVLSFLQRSMFDIPAYGESSAGWTKPGPKPAPPAGNAEPAGAEELKREAAMLRWLQGDGQLPIRHLPRRWTPELRAALASALGRFSPKARLRLYANAAFGNIPADVLDPASGLEDPDAAFRYKLLQRWPHFALNAIPRSVREALRNDPSPTVREAAEDLGL